MLTLLLTGVSLFVVWVLWTYIVRPALEDFGIMPPLGVNDIPEPAPQPAPAVMSRPAASPAAAPDTDTGIAVVCIPPGAADRDIVQALARVKTLDGAWRWSANTIVAFVGGNRNEVLEWVRAVRPAPVAVTQAHRPEREYAGSAGHPYQAPPA